MQIQDQTFSNVGELRKWLVGKYNQTRFSTNSCSVNVSKISKKVYGNIMKSLESNGSLHCQRSNEIIKTNV